MNNNDYLMHHGIKGQKWGNRRYQNKDGSYTTEGKARRRVVSGKSGLTKSRRSVITSKGERINLEPVEAGKLAQFLQNHSRRFREMNDQESSITITNSSGKKVGNLFLEKRGNDELNINWIDISNKERGKGYASAVLRDTVRYAKENGFKKVTLEVPGHSPDARHIYEKVGFKATKIISDDDVWDGLTAMELNLDELEHSDYLIHHGIKGQKWGVRRYQNEDGSYTEEGKARRRVDSGKAGVSPEIIAYTPLIVYETATIANAVRKSIKAKAFIESGKDPKRIQRDKTVTAGTRDNIIPNGYKKLTSKHDSYADVIKNKQVNPEPGIGSNLNCLSCSMAVELRRRGIDATATKGIQYLNGGRPIFEINKIFKDPCPRRPGGQKVMSRADLERWAKKNYPKGARGTIAVFFQFGGGHAMSWDIDKSGKLTIYDGQSGKIVDKNWASEKFLTGWQNSYMTRLDNLEINTDSGPNNKLIRASEDWIG